MMMLVNIIPASSLSVSPSHHLNPNPPPLPPLFPISSSTITFAALSSHHYYNTEQIITRRRTKSSRRRTRWAVSASASSDNQMAVAAPPSTTASPSSSEVVRNFYGGINGRDLASVEDLIAQNCVYEDLIFSRPFVGRKAILEFFQKFIDSISMDLQFVIDDISNEDTSALGVTWHLEWKGKPFPFSKGCSFYRLDVVNGKRQIIYGRDCVEPATKPGEMALVAIRGVTWLLQQFPQLADRL